MIKTRRLVPLTGSYQAKVRPAIKCIRSKFCACDLGHLECELILQSPKHSRQPTIGPRRLRKSPRDLLRHKKPPYPLTRNYHIKGYGNLVGATRRTSKVGECSLEFIRSLAWPKTMSRTVLVTGGAGYIGSHICKALAEAGAVPVCYDNLEKGNTWAVRWGPLERGDIGDADRLEEVFRHHRPRAVIHLAGYIEVGESVQQPERYLRNNATKTDTLIAASLRHGVDGFVFSSTCAVYGLPQKEFLDETHPIAPISPYAESKAMVERALTAAAESGLRSASMRYFNAAGADAGGEIGEAHAPETHLLPLATDAALGLGPRLTLLGDDYDTPDGSCVRDFVHVTDLTEAHLLALGWLKRQPAAGVHNSFNLGCGTGYSVMQVLAETARIAGCKVPYNVGPRRPGDSPKLVGNIAHTERELGWKPTRNLASQIEDTLRWRRRMPR